MSKKTDPDQKDTFQAKYRKACQFIDQHLRRQGAHAVGILQTGKRISWIARSHAYRYDDCQSFEQWRETKLQLCPEWTAKYMLIGSAFTVSELKGKQLSVQALAAIARMEGGYRETLLQHGQRHEASVIRAAHRRAVATKDQTKGTKLIIEMLARPEGSVPGKTRISSASLPLPRHAQRCQRRLGSLLPEIRVLRERLEEKQELPGTERLALEARVEMAVRELWELNRVLTGHQVPLPDFPHMKH